jgi:hypothetical protein
MEVANYKLTRFMQCAKWDVALPTIQRPEGEIETRVLEET